jgi:beta-glucosidase
MSFNWVNSLIGGLLLQTSVIAATPFTSPYVRDTPTYKDPSAPIEARVEDLLSRMDIHDKTAQLMQGDITNWMDTDTGNFNYSGLVENMKTKAGSFWTGMTFGT